MSSSRRATHRPTEWSQNGSVIVILWLNRSSATRSAKKWTLKAAKQDEKGTVHSDNVANLNQWDREEINKILCLSSDGQALSCTQLVFRHATETQLGLKWQTKTKKEAAYLQRVVNRKGTRTPPKRHEFTGYWPVLFSDQMGFAQHFFSSESRQWVNALDVPRSRNQSNRAKSTIHLCCIYLQLLHVKGSLEYHALSLSVIIAERPSKPSHSSAFTVLIPTKVSTSFGDSLE